ncbi:MAG: hypothetical protein ACFFBV_09545 [Promethearchaeota archaeon]
MRKILFRHPAIRSGRARVDFHLSLSHEVLLPIPDSYRFNLMKRDDACQGIL